MRKYLIVCCVWISILGIKVVSSSSNMNYVLYCDSKNTNTFASKQNIIDIYNSLCEGVNTKSNRLLVRHNLPVFAYAKNVRVKFNNSTLKIIEGDGLGDEIGGRLMTFSHCLPKVQPKSILMRLFE